MSSLNLCRDENVCVGKPTLKEIKEYLLNSGSYTNANDSSTSNSSIELNDSFQNFLDTKLLQIRNNKEMERSVDESIQMNATNGVLGGHDTFMTMERLCEKSMSEDSLEIHDIDDVTQLNDIEEPSMLWENTLNQTAPKLTPMKLCAMNRPSTILEEDSLLLSENSKSSVSTNALVELLDLKEGRSSSDDPQNIPEDTQSTVEEDSFVTAGCGVSTMQKPSENTSTGTSSYLTATAAITQNGSSIISIESSAASSMTDEDVVKIRKNIYFDDDGNLMGPTVIKSESSSTDYMTAKNSNVIEIVNLVSDQSTLTNSSSENRIEQNTLDDLSSLPDDENSRDDKEVEEEEDDDDPELNDSLEKMEYMMKKGLKFMQQSNLMTPVALNATKAVCLTPTSGNNSPQTPSTVVRVNKFNSCEKLGAIIKHPASSAHSNLTQFKKPTSGSSKLPIPRNGPNLLHKPKRFEDIISPISLYIKQSPSVPFVSSMKSNKNIFETKLSHIRDSQYYGSGVQPLMDNQHKADKEKENKIEPVCPLPRKAYISAETKHYIDERKQPKIHGGEKVNRLLRENVSPIVAKHEGRVKYGHLKSASHDIVDESLNELSIASGDVSVQIVRNVNRF